MHNLDDLLPGIKRLRDFGADGAFEKAPASLHRFKEGSFKQTTFRKGNLQVSFASRPDGRVVIDLDLARHIQDLYP